MSSPPQLIARTGELSPPRRLDLRTVAGAALAVLLLRLILGVWALPASALYPDNPLEQQVIRV